MSNTFGDALVRISAELGSWYDGRKSMGCGPRQRSEDAISNMGWQLGEAAPPLFDLSEKTGIGL